MLVGILSPRQAGQLLAAHARLGHAAGRTTLAHFAGAQWAGCEGDQNAGVTVGNRQRPSAACAVELLGDEIERQRQACAGTLVAGAVELAASGLAGLCVV